MEEYRKVTPPCYQDYYEVSDEGNVKRIGRYVINNGTPQWLPEMILSGGTNKYRRNERSVDFCVNKEIQRFKIHHLVVWAFPEICGEWFEGAEVDHIDGDPTNNKATNLRVTDRIGNMNNPNTKQKLSEIVLNNKEERERRAERMKGDNNPARRCMTDEWRKHIGEAQKIRWSKNRGV